jgi:hypothetical protein
MISTMDHKQPIITILRKLFSTNVNVIRDVSLFTCPTSAAVLAPVLKASAAARVAATDAANVGPTREGEVALALALDAAAAVTTGAAHDK